MTSSGKVRIYELSKDLGLENKDVLDAAEKLSIAARSHSSSISDTEAGKIRNLLKQGGSAVASAPTKPAPGKAILSVKKASSPAAPSMPSKPVAPAAAKPSPKPSAPSRPGAPLPQIVQQPVSRQAAPQKPVSRPSAPAVAAPAPSAAAPSAPTPRPKPAAAPSAPKPSAPAPTASAPSAPARPTSAKPAPVPSRPTGTSPVKRPGSEASSPRPTAPPARQQPKAPVNRGAPQRPAPKPELVGRPQPKRAAPGAPVRQIGQRPGVSPRPSGPPGQRSNMPQRPAGAQRPGAPTRPGDASAKPGQPPQPRVRLNWSANPSAEMATTTAPVAAAMDKDVHLVQDDLEPPVLVACQGCVSRWLLVSSCSSKSRITDRQRHRRDVLMARLLPHVAVRLPLGEPKIGRASCRERV